MNRPHPPRWLLLTVAVGINFVWALSYPLSKQLVLALSPLTIATARMVGGALLIAPLLRRRDVPKSPKLHEAGLFLAMGLLGCGLPALLQYVGTASSTSSNVAMIVSLEPSAVAILSALLIKEPIRFRQKVAFAVALIGVAVITVDPASLSLFSSRYLRGNMILLASIFFYASYTVSAKKLSGRWGTSTLTVLPFAIAAAVMLPALATFHPEEMNRLSHLSASDAWGLAFVVVLATALGYIIWNWLLRFLSASEVALSLYIQPLAGALLSSWILGEHLAPFFLGGSLLVLVALAMGQPGRDLA